MTNQNLLQDNQVVLIKCWSVLNSLVTSSKGSPYGPGPAPV